MSARRKPVAPLRRRPKVGPKLPEPQSECSTTSLLNELSREVKAMLRGRKRRRKDSADGAPPKAS